MFKIRHSFFFSIKEFVEQKDNLSFRICYLAELFIFIYYTARICSTTLILWTKRTSTFKHYDYLYILFTEANAHLYNEVFLLQFASMGLFNFICRHGLYNSSFAFKKFYIYVVLNTESYWRNKKSKEEQATLRRQYIKSELGTLHQRKFILANTFHELINKVYLRCQSAVHFFFSCQNAHLENMKEEECFQAYFNIPFELRIILIWIVKLIDFTCLIFQLFVIMLLIIFCIFYFHFFSKHVSAYFYPWIALDFFCIAYQFMTIVRTGAIYSFFSVVAAVLFNVNLVHARKRLTTAVKNGLLLQGDLEHFFTEHSRVCIDVLKGNRELWSRIALSFLCTMLPPNVYLLLTITFERLQPFESVVIWTVLVGQSIATGLVLWPMASFVQVLHNCSRYLVAVQKAISPNFLWHKLKYDDLFGRLVRGPLYGVTIGPFHSVNFETIFTLTGMYSAYILFGFSLKLQLK